MSWPGHEEWVELGSEQVRVEKFMICNMALKPLTRA